MLENGGHGLGLDSVLRIFCKGTTKIAHMQISAQKSFGNLHFFAFFVVPFTMSVSPAYYAGVLFFPFLFLRISGESDSPLPILLSQ